MNFEKPRRRQQVEPQLATMIDVFSILIIFLIAGTAMDNSILDIPAGLELPKTISKANSLMAPQVTLKDGVIEANFIKEKITIEEIESNNSDSQNIKRIGSKLKSYLLEIREGDKENLTEVQLLQSINLVADKETPYQHVFTTMKFFRSFGFQDSILVGTEGSELTK